VKLSVSEIEIFCQLSPLPAAPIEGVFCESNTVRLPLEMFRMSVDAAPSGCRFEAAHKSAEDILRVAFLEMIFALAISDVAVHLADLVDADKNRLGQAITWVDKMPSVAHLAIGFFLVTCSWVGWRMSPSPLMKGTAISDLFTVTFFTMLLDVAIVILYFLLIKGVEVQNKAGNCFIDPPDAKPECMWMFFIFAVYAIWDLFTDIFNQKAWGQMSDVPELRKKKWLAIFLSPLASLICVGLSFFAWHEASRCSSNTQVILIDIALIALVFGFRLLKAIETPLANLLKIREFKAFETARIFTWRHGAFAVLLVVLYLAGIVAPRFC
jgi:hypothetical protein